MKKIHIIVAIFYIAYSQSEDATLTIYKDGSALIKQPVAWSVPAGNSYVETCQVAFIEIHLF